MYLVNYLIYINKYLNKGCMYIKQREVKNV